MINFEIWLKVWKFHLIVNLECITLTRIDNGLFYQVFEFFWDSIKKEKTKKLFTNNEEFKTEVDSVPF